MICYSFVLEHQVFFFNFLLEVELIYNIVLISAVQQNDSVIYTKIHTHSYKHSFLLFIIGC